MIVVYAEQDSPRLQYIVNELFKHMHGIDVELTWDVEKYYALPEEQPKICYAEENIGRGLHITPKQLLFEEGIKEQEIDVETDNGQTFMYRTGREEDDTIAYDIFAAAFYLVSRYEEYLPFQADQHGRFKATDSIAFKHGFLEEPVVDQWMQIVLKKLERLFPGKIHSKRTFRHIKTIDVDNVFAYRHKGLLINGLHLLADFAKGRMNIAKQRLKVILRLQDDPFFNLEELADTLRPYAKDTHFFFHCGCYGKHDKKVWFPSRSYVKIRKFLDQNGFNVGLHPSYRSAHKKWIFHKEKSILEQHLGHKVTSCRSHYLLYTLPGDYRMLVEEKIHDDYTMGYSNNPGFRAGTSLPFHFYDLGKEENTSLTIHPLIVMDKTLHANLKLDIPQAKAYIKRLAEKVRLVNGEFVTLFHNENQTDAEGFGWKGWNNLYKEIIEEIQ